MDWKYLYLTFEGRIPRKDFWIGGVLLWLVQIVVSVVIPILSIPVSLAAIYPGAAVGVKRCHDRGKSGWWCLLALVPILGWIWALVDLGILKGQPGSNDYGPNPLGDEPLPAPETPASPTQEPPSGPPAA